LSYQLAGREQFINLKTPNGARSLEAQTFKWDLANLALAAGDRVAYRLEVADNDSVSGPKVSYSRTFHLSVRDARARAVKEGEEAQQIADALLDLLGDQLEATRAQETLAKVMEEVLKKVDKNLERMEKNRADRFDLEALRRNLASLKERMLEEQKETVTQEMERLALLAEDIAKRARMNEVEALARQIGEGEWLETLPDGLQTDVGQRGMKLSMGQRQLVALMRVLIQRPAIFILDEATASVDPFTEEQIQEALDLILRKSTAIIIAHRLSTVRSADRIIVLRKGQIIEEGNHASLLRQGGHYAELYNTYFRHQSIDYIEKAVEYRAAVAAD